MKTASPPVTSEQITVLKSTVAAVSSAVPVKASAPIVVVALASLAVTSLPQPLNALAPRVVRSGASLMSTWASSLIPSNAEAPMVVSEVAAAKLMKATLAQFLKAPGAIVVTVASMMMTTFVPQHCALPFVAYAHVVALV